MTTDEITAEYARGFIAIYYQSHNNWAEAHVAGLHAVEDAAKNEERAIFNPVTRTFGNVGNVRVQLTPSLSELNTDSA